MVFRYFSLYEYVPTIDLCILATTIYVYMTSLEMISAHMTKVCLF